MSRLECERWASLLDREALEGALTRDDVAFQTEHPRSCENCAHELAAWRVLGALNPTQTTALERDVALEEAALNQLWHEAPAPGIRALGRPRIALTVTLAVLATAAAVLLFVSRQRQPADVDGRLAHATLGSGRAIGDGDVAHLAGEVVRTGARLRAEAEPLCLLIELSNEDAWAFAQFLKRVALDDYRRLAVDGEEAYAMQAAGEALGRALAAQGHAPR